MIKLTDKQNSIIRTLGYDDTDAFVRHYPFRYETLALKPVNQWIKGDDVIFCGTLASDFKSFRFAKNRIRTTFEVLLDDSVIGVTLFNRPYLKSQTFREYIVVIGTYQGAGKVIAKSINTQPLQPQLGIKAVYSTKKGVHQYEITRILSKVFDKSEYETYIPKELVDAYHLMSTKDALKGIHFPESNAELTAALRTLKYEEFLTYQLYGILNETKRVGKTPLAIDYKYVNSVINTLPYALTADQNNALKDILQDINSTSQMNRLLQGDVGSGKTIIALLAALSVIRSGRQVVFMVPTEVLLEQHVKTVNNLFPSLKVVTLSQSTQNRGEMLNLMKTGKAELVIGTHSLFQDDVLFSKLGLVIIDEQHRFGVSQRKKLIAKSNICDVLLLSATPIPRTLAASIFFDLDVSTIATYPSYRKEVNTLLIAENSLRSIVDVVKAEIEDKGQVYIVCPAIEETENRIGVRNVEQIYAQMLKLFDTKTVAMLHGKMKSQEKEEVMRRFNEGVIDILVSTTVIEVGIDVHNANMMIIYNAELFGLATLHQLRGRVGRGEKQGTCYLLSNSEGEGLTRLKLLCATNDGFKLSMEDLRNRGMGDLLGERQSGVPHFILGDIEKDTAMLMQSKHDAHWIIENRNYPSCEKMINWVLHTKKSIDGV